MVAAIATMAAMVGGCEASSDNPSATREAATSASGNKGSASSPSTKASTAPLQTGPPAASAAASAQRAAVLSLLSDGQAQRLPLSASDGDKAFDPDLPRRLSPMTLARPARISSGEINSQGRLPPEVIQRIVRRHYGRYRLCYEDARKAAPKLQGEISVRFVIGSNGKVTSASASSPDITDQGFIGCITKHSRSLNFPQPEGGIVTVTYPLKFSPP